MEVMTADPTPIASVARIAVPASPTKPGPCPLLLGSPPLPESGDGEAAKTADGPKRRRASGRDARNPARLADRFRAAGRVTRLEGSTRYQLPSSSAVSRHAPRTSVV